LVDDATNTLCLHFIHHFAVKSALSASVSRRRRRGMPVLGEWVMKARKLRRAGFLLVCVAALSLPYAAHAAEAIDITLDQASIMRLPEKVATIVVGNPMIADVAVQSGGLVVVTGKGFGSTNIIALDRTGSVLMERDIVVSGPDGRTVQVFRGVQRETYSCTPNCERRITLGDSADYFTATMGQSDARNGSAQSGAAAAKPSAR
jgi:Flp pilus assembly secretin CpaC